MQIPIYSCTFLSNNVISWISKLFCLLFYHTHSSHNLSIVKKMPHTKVDILVTAKIVHASTTSNVVLIDIFACWAERVKKLQYNYPCMTLILDESCKPSFEICSILFPCCFKTFPLFCSILIVSETKIYSCDMWQHFPTNLRALWSLSVSYQW